MMPTRSPISKSIRTTSIQNLWGLLYCYISPFSCLLDLSKFSFTLSTSSVKSSIFLSDSSISSPVFFTFIFHSIVNWVRSSSRSSIASSAFFHLYIALSSISVGPLLFLLFPLYIFLFLLSGSSSMALASVRVSFFLPVPIKACKSPGPYIISSSPLAFSYNLEMICKFIVLTFS